MEYRHSKYNFEYFRSDGTYVIYNTYSKAVVSLNMREKEQYDNLSFTDPEMEKELLENGILVKNTFNEEQFLRYCHNLTKYSRESLHLILALTMDCNFGCPYCYENRRRGKMSQEVQEAILKLIQKNLQSGMKEMDVTWYGGEPMLHPEIIESLGEKINQLLDGTDCVLNMYMVTNGYLFTEETVEMIDRIGVSKVQITLDGLRENHDARRHLRNGAGTFDKIVENLKLFEEYSIRVDVRMNVDNENARDFNGLQELLAGLENPNIVLYPSPVEDINHDTVNEVSDFMSYDQFEKFAGDICSPSAATRVLDDRYCFCQAETVNTFVIDELGYCYKCWDQAGRIEMACFNILTQDDKNMENIISFLGWDPFQDEKCSDCVFLPVCFGGCKFHRMNTGRYDCGFTDQSMKAYLEQTYFG